MSRTRHHREQKRQHLGRDLWSRRPCTGMLYNAYNKRLTRRIERTKEPKVIEQEMTEINCPHDEPCCICGQYHHWEPDGDECEMYVINLIGQATL